MFLARIAFFTIHESPRYLVNAGRHQEALESLQMISKVSALSQIMLLITGLMHVKFNGSELALDLGDVDDRPVPPVSRTGEAAPFLGESLSRRSEDPHNATVSEHHASRPSQNRQVIFDALDAPEGDSQPAQHGPRNAATQRSSDVLNSSSNVPRYDSTSDSDTPLGSHSFNTPAMEVPPTPQMRGPAQSAGTPSTSPVTSFAPTDPASAPGSPSVARRPRPPRPRSGIARRSSVVSRSSYYEVEKRVGWRLPETLRKPFLAWIDRVSLVLAPEWWWSTVLVWLAWCFMALAYTMFNVFLPKMLETRGGGDALKPKSLEDSLWDVMIFTVGGCPGAIVSVS
jgi:hypothetical protein